MFRTYKPWVLLFFAVVGFQTLSAQTNFFTKEIDSLTTDFYIKNKQATVLITGALPIKTFGATLFIHNNENKISYVLNIQTNGTQTAFISGTEIEGAGVQQKIIPYSTANINFGLAHAYSGKAFVYGYIGTVYSYSNFKNQQGEGYNYKNIPSGMNLNLGMGIMYVANNNYSFLVGLQSYNSSVLLGIGYTL